ncbi:hypothetical protein NKH86_31370 [Mesorhizobium sp. M0913]|uniref:hypothetical protein n=1 Tax=Mesorhizobium sp. M0913 TaxID=2957026 RepID=UPI0033366968
MSIAGVGEGGEPPDGLDQIRELCSGEVNFKTEGWRNLIFMQQLRLWVGNEVRVTDAVLCLNHNNPTYPTKLYMAENVGGPVNWNEANVPLLGRYWHSFSWRDVSPALPYHEILAAHLAPLASDKAA